MSLKLIEYRATGTKCPVCGAFYVERNGVLLDSCDCQDQPVELFQQEESLETLCAHKTTYHPSTPRFRELERE